MQNDLISRSALRGDFLKNCRMECCICPDRDQESGECNLVCCAPTVDAVEVIRCEHCKFAEKMACIPLDSRYCGIWDTVVKANGYCYQGTPRKEHGYWISEPKGYGYYCSECRSCSVHLLPKCPKCHAKMDAKEDSSDDQS